MIVVVVSEALVGVMVRVAAAVVLPRGAVAAARMVIVQRGRQRIGEDIARQQQPRQNFAKDSHCARPDELPQATLIPYDFSRRDVGWKIDASDGIRMRRLCICITIVIKSAGAVNGGVPDRHLRTGVQNEWQSECRWMRGEAAAWLCCRIGMWRPVPAGHGVTGLHRHTSLPSAKCRRRR